MSATEFVVEGQIGDFTVRFKIKHAVDRAEAAVFNRHDALFHREALNAHAVFVGMDALRQAVAMLVPPKSKEQNLKAVERGIEWGGEPQCP